MAEPDDSTGRISGSTRLYAVLGDPIAQVRAPVLVNRLFADLSHDAVLVPVHVTAEDLATVVRGLQRTRNLDGILITVPHKMSCVALADTVSSAVELSGSTNAMRREPDGRWHADNFDGAGFVAGLRAAGHTLAGRRVTLVGAGGAGSAIAPAALTAGAGSLAICDHDPARATALVRRLRNRWPDQVAEATVPALADADLVVNATPLGLRPDDPLPFDPDQLRKGTLVADIVMKPRETRLLRAAAARGLPVHPGEPMLTSQVELYRTFFRLDAAPAVRQLAAPSAPTAAAEG